MSQSGATIGGFGTGIAGAIYRFFTAKTPEGTLDDSARGPARMGLAVVVVLFGFFGIWGATAPLQSAVIAPGVVEVDGNRKTLQHPEGGVVRAILVKEGDFVHRGQVLIRLDQLQARAVRDITLALFNTMKAQQARLIAERDGKSEITFPVELTSHASDPAVASILQGQRELFIVRRDALAGKEKVLREQVAQAGSSEAGMHGEVSAADEQRRLVLDELASTQSLYEKGFATKTKVLALQRAAAALEGQRLEYSANAGRAQHGVAEAQAQILQLQQDWLTDVSTQLDDIQGKLIDVTQRLRAVQAVLDDTEIKAPVTGRVIALAVHTIGGVIAKGEPLMEIVPATGPQIVTARISPVDAEHVWAGMETDVRVVTTKTDKPPVLHGHVASRSADRLTDERTGQSFYTVRIALNPRDVEEAGDVSLAPGMPVEVVVPTGERTAFGYLLEPLTNSFRHGMKEK
ncbi:MAG TPA: HlyD family type I secretion periplasmic adaptor subunit [Rhizomicrobium sp.]|jgi:HlyD family type I secretion membrane fusion protein|nr:HlyD family type I secretion periplasmic adaptor subunit [Rhizomicrobium sp.]